MCTARASAVCAWVALAAGCTGAVGAGPVDAAGREDAMTPLADGGPALDASRVLDAASPLDAAAVPDAASPVDAAALDPPGLPTGPVDALLAGLAPSTWALLPRTPMQDVCPGYVDGQPGNHYLCGAVVSAWSGGAFDDARDRLLVFGGGHADSFYNQVFAFDLAALRWQVLSAPTRDATAEATQPWLDEPFYEPCGYYPNGDHPIDEADRRPEYREFIQPALCTRPDIAARLDTQQPRSTHTYGNLAYVPALDALCTTGSIGMWRSGQSASAVTACFELAQRRWRALGPVPRPGYGMSAVDARGHVWLVHDGGLAELDPATGTWTARGDGVGALYGSAAIDPRSDTLYLLTPGTGALVARDLRTAGSAFARRAAPPAALTRQNPGFAWVPHLERFYAWAGGRALYVYDPARDTWSTEEGGGDDPGEAATNGTFGRFRASVHRRVLVVVSSTQRDVAVYKLRP